MYTGKREIPPRNDNIQFWLLDAATLALFCSERFWQLHPVQYSAMPLRTKDTAKAVNSFIEVGRNDQQALLEVLQEYYTSSGNSTDQESDESDEANDIEESIEAAELTTNFTCKAR